MVQSRVLAAAVGAASLALGLWAFFGEHPAMAVGAGAVGMVAGLIALVAEPGTARGAGAARRADSGPDDSTELPTGIDGPTGRDLPTERDVGPIRRVHDSPSGIPWSEETGVGRGDAITDPVTSLFSEAYMRVALESRLAAARRHLRPVALIVMQATEGLPGGDSIPASPERVADAIRSTIRDADTACRLDDGTFSVILEDTPENGAVWTVERIRRNLVSRAGHHTMWAGVACYPAHAFDGDTLMNQACTALLSARDWNQDRIEVATAP